MREIKVRGKPVVLSKFVLASLFCGVSGFAIFSLACYELVLAKAFNFHNNDEGKQSYVKAAKQAMKRNAIPFAEVVIIMLPPMILLEVLPFDFSWQKIVVPIVCFLFMVAVCVSLRFLGIREVNCCKEIANSSGLDSLLLPFQVEECCAKAAQYDVAKSEEDSRAASCRPRKVLLKVLLHIPMLPFFIVLSSIRLIEGVVFSLMAGLSNIFDRAKSSRKEAVIQGTVEGSSVSKDCDEYSKLAKEKFCESAFILLFPLHLQFIVSRGSPGARVSFARKSGGVSIEGPQGDALKRSCCRSQGDVAGGGPSVVTSGETPTIVVGDVMGVAR